MSEMGGAFKTKSGFIHRHSGVSVGDRKLGRDKFKTLTAGYDKMAAKKQVKSRDTLRRMRDKALFAKRLLARLPAK